MHMFASIMVRTSALRAKDHRAGGSYVGKRRGLGVNVQGLAVLETWLQEPLDFTVVRPGGYMIKLSSHSM